jgi:hypothetical protein
VRSSSLVLVGLFAVLGCRAAPAPETTAPETTAPAPVFVEQPELTAKPAPTPAPTLTLASFDAFMGLRYGDTLEDVRRLWGEAAYAEIDDEGDDTYYYVMTEDTVPDDGPPGAGDDFLFVITIDKATSRVFNLQANTGDYAANGIEDPLLRFLGAPLSEVEATFGPPTRAHAGFNTYEYVDEDRNLELQVEFLCYDWEEFRCRELWVTWYMP